MNPKVQQQSDAIKFPMGAEVYHKTEPDKMGIVIQVRMIPGCYIYVVQWARNMAGDHYDFELTSERGADYA